MEKKITCLAAKEGNLSVIKTIASVIIMIIVSAAGLFLGALLNNAIGGMILVALVSGIACIIYTLEKQNS